MGKRPREVGRRDGRRVAWVGRARNGAGWIRKVVGRSAALRATFPLMRVMVSDFVLLVSRLYL